MKKWMICLWTLFVLVGCAQTPIKEMSDAQKFKEEYEALNGTIRESDGNTIVSLTISDSNPMRYATYDDVNRLLDGGTGIVYMGFSDCPWCRSMLPVFLEACDDQIVTEVLYLNNKQDRDLKELNSSGEVVTIHDGSESYKALLERLGDWADEYDGLKDSSIKRIYYPTILFVAEGKVVAKHVGTANGVENAYLPLTQTQYDELFDAMVKNIQATKEACDKKC